MRLRSILFVLFCLIAVAPLLLFWFLPNSRVLESEFNEVEERHLIIAENLSKHLDSYYFNLTNAFNFVVNDAKLHDTTFHYSSLFDNLNIRHICVAESATGKILQSLHANGPVCPPIVPSKRFEWMKEQLGNAKNTTISTPVVGTPDGENVFYLLVDDGNTLNIGAVRTNYLVNVGRSVKFGELGHAAIVDSAGKAISHPRSDWEESRHDMSKISVVKAMLNGETGVKLFYSPTLDADMIAGYAPVAGPGWGVMVPQPVRELQAKAESVKSAGLAVLLFGVVLAAIFALIASKILTNPIEQMVRSMHRIGAGELRAYEEIKVGRWQPEEFVAARNGIKAMSVRLQENIDTISRHAYLDGITGLPNRECFRVLAQEEIEKMQASGQKCAILFLDLDGFKQVNDVYGHRSGDDLLKGFAQKLHAYSGTVMKQHARGIDTAVRVLPARLGGDEFVVLLSNINDISFPAEFASGLFSRVFGPFKIHNGVSLQVSGSVGGAVFPDQADDFDELLRLADIAMYEAKNTGKGKYCLYTPEEEDYVDEKSSGEFLPA